MAKDKVTKSRNEMSRAQKKRVAAHDSIKRKKDSALFGDLVAMLERMGVDIPQIQGETIRSRSLRAVMGHMHKFERILELINEDLPEEDPLAVEIGKILHGVVDDSDTATSNNEDAEEEDVAEGSTK